MATRYVSPTASGSGTGTSASRWTVAQANAGAQAGDLVLFAPGYYTNTLAPAHSGTGDADSQRIIFAAEDSTNKPVFSGASTATNGSSAPGTVGGWSQSGTNLSGGVLTYPNGPNSGSTRNYVWRCSSTFTNVIGVWCNHPDQSVSGVPTTGPTSYYHSLWQMGKYNTDGGLGSGSNGDYRIHERNGHSYGGNTDGSDPYALHDWQAMARWNNASSPAGLLGMPNNTLDVRLHDPANHNPNNYFMVVGVRDVGFQVTNQSYITLRNMAFRHFRKCEAVNASGFVLDGCDLLQMGETIFILGEPSNNVKVLNCTLIGGGAWHGHYSEVIGSGSSSQGCNNVLVENCEMSHTGHGGLTIFHGDSWTIRGNNLHHCGTAMLADRTCSNWLIEENDIVETGFVEDVNILKAPHNGLEIDSMVTATVRRNTFNRCGIGIRLQAAFNIQNVDIRHNTFVDCQIANIHLNAPYSSLGDGLHDCLYRNNIFYGPSGGSATYRGTYLSGGPAAMVYETMPFTTQGSTLNNQTVRRNLYAHAIKDGITPLAIKGGNTGTSTNIQSASGTTVTNVFGSAGAERGPEVTGADIIAGIFVDKANFDFRLAPGSIAIGAGVAINGEPSNDLGRYPLGTGGGGTNPAPTLDLRTNATNITPGSVITFNANGSDRDAAGNDTSAALQYNWTFGDGGTASGTGFASNDQKTHTYTTIGNFTCTCRVTDAAGLWVEDQQVITVANAASGVEIASGLSAVTSFGVGGTDQAGQTPDKLIDGFWATGSRGGGGGGTAGVNNWARNNLAAAPQGVIVDLGRAVTLTRLLLSHYPGGGGTRNYNYTLATSPTNLSGSYTDIGTQSTSLSQEFAEIPFAGRTNVRYVKVTVNSASDGSNTASLWELRAFEQTTTNAPPTVNLAANVTSGPATLTVNFTATVTDETVAANCQFHWDFGDGTTFDGQGTTTRSKSYSVAGNYTAAVTVTDSGGLTGTDSRLIQVTGAPVNNAPTLTLTSTPSPATGAVPLTVNFAAVGSDTETATSSLTYAWAFGDGTTSTSQNPSKTYNSSGVYNAVCTVSDSGIPTSQVQSANKTIVVTAQAGGANAWPLSAAFDHLNTPSGVLFGPDRTLNLKYAPDGDPASRWVAAILPGQTYIGWDLGQNRVVKRLRVYLDKQINGRAYNITLQSSLDKVAWSNLSGITNVNTSTGVYFNEYVLGTAVNARYLRIVFNSSTNGCASVWFIAPSDV